MLIRIELAFCKLGANHLDNVVLLSLEKINELTTRGCQFFVKDKDNKEYEITKNSYRVLMQRMYTNLD
jgi:hypothetical protein